MKVIWQTAVIRQERDAIALLNSKTTNLIARRFFLGLAWWLQEHRKKSVEPPLCLTCDFAFRGSKPPGTFLMMYSEDPAVEHLVLTGVCRKCAKKNSDVELLKVGVVGLCQVVDGEVLGYTSEGSEAEH